MRVKEPPSFRFRMKKLKRLTRWDHHSPHFSASAQEITSTDKQSKRYCLAFAGLVEGEGLEPSRSFGPADFTYHHQQFYLLIYSFRYHFIACQFA
jgi:hypothetical protein